MKFDLTRGKLPTVTSKFVSHKAVLDELLWFLRGDTDTRHLSSKIWQGNSSREYLDSIGLEHIPTGCIGPAYGHQWRNFGGDYWLTDDGQSAIAGPSDSGIDQITELIHMIRTNPTCRRMLVCAWNPLQQAEMALPPCHMMFQVYVTGDGQLDLLWYQRSVDLFLGFPYNVTSYSFLAHLIARKCGLVARNLIFMGGDIHLYKNHLDQARELLTRTIHPDPTVEIDAAVIDLDWKDITLNHIVVNGYQSNKRIPAPMAI